MLDTPGFCVLVVSHNERDLLHECLLRLRNEGIANYGEIIVLDNASRDGTPQMVEAEFPEVRLLKHETNLGFARAVNRGISASEVHQLLAK